MALSDTARLPQAGWLRSREFDIGLICGLTAVSLAAGGVIALAPVAIGLIMLIDTWILALRTSWRHSSAWRLIGQDCASIAS